MKVRIEERDKLKKINLGSVLVVEDKTFGDILKVMVIRITPEKYALLNLENCRAVLKTVVNEEINGKSVDSLIELCVKEEHLEILRVINPENIELSEI